MPGTNSIDGLNSGLNTTEIIDAIIQFERRNAVFLEIEQAQKTNIISGFKALQAKFLALGARLKTLTKASTFEAQAVTVSDDTFLTATASGRAGTGTYDIQVLSTARNHQLASQGFTNESLADLGTGTISIQIGDGSANLITIDSTNNSLIGIKKAINDADVGVTASIINDGTSSNAFRLLLSSNNSGVSNRITVTPSLSGGNNLNFSTATFDIPEVLTSGSSSDSAISLGAAAAFTGTTNKIYTFTVGGSGIQTVGSDNITIDWTDGTNSGTILVTQADSEVILAGAGSEGLTLSFSAGELTSGDTFQLGTFAPLLQEATDARLAVGSSGGAGSPILVTSRTNTFKDIIGGLTLTVLKETEAGSSITINTDLDLKAIRTAIDEFIKSYNDVNEFIDKQNSYNSETKESGVLFGDLTLQIMQSSLRKALGSNIVGLNSKFNQLLSVGIRTLPTGRLSIVDSSRLEDALKNNLDDVINLFTSAGNSTSALIEFASSSSETINGVTFEVDITQAATHGRFQGSGIGDPATTPLILGSSSNRLKFKIDGLLSDELVLAEKTYNTATELVNEIQSKIDSDDKIGSRGLTVEWISSGAGTGYLQFNSSTYGSTSKVEIVTSIANSAFNLLGLSNGSVAAGIDVEGTINGETAEGIGQFLTGKEGNSNTSGLKLKILLDSSQIGDGAEGNITVTKGVATRLDELIKSLTESGDGTFDRRISAMKSQVDHLAERIEEIDKRLASRRESLFRQFIEMESILGVLNSQGQFLTTQLAQINANWKIISGN